MSRLDRLTPRTKETEYYSDFLVNLDRNPISGELARVNNERSIIRAIKNLMLTDFGERPDPRIGSNLKHLLFEPMDDVTVDLIKSSIRTCINQFEPRVKLQLVDVKPDEVNNSYYVSITFIMVNAPSEILSFDTILKRVR